MNLVKEWQAQCARELSGLLGRGFYFPADVDMKMMSDEELTIRYFNVLDRIPTCCPRTVCVCKNVTITDETRAGYQELLNELRAGSDLLPRMSKSAKNIMCCDGMLNDWNIHHFHLKPRSTTRDGAVERSGDVAYVYLTDKVAYVIAIAPHGEWANQKLLERLDSDFPDALSEWRTPFLNISYEVDAEERKFLRKSHLNMMVKINGRVYACPNGGESLDGTRALVVHRVLRTRHFLKRVEEVLRRAWNDGKFSAWPTFELEKCSLKGFMYNQAAWQLDLQDNTGCVYRVLSEGADVAVKISRVDVIRKA